MTFSKSRTARGSAMVTDWNNTIQIQLGDHNQHAGHAPEVHTCGSPTLTRHNIAKQIANAKIGTGSCRTKSAQAESNPEMTCMRMDFDPFRHLKYGLPRRVNSIILIRTKSERVTKNTKLISI